ncbi:MAG: hypothetical protein ACLQVF_15650 [Isosphaeraceae bacterium]
MSGPHPRALISSLALAVAAGKTVAAWANENKIPLRTAYEWHRRPEFKRAVHRYRRRYVDRALGLLARNAAKSASVVVRLADKAESEAVQLQAARAVLADLMSVSRFADVEERISELERHHGDRLDEPADPA